MTPHQKHGDADGRVMPCALCLEAELAAREAAVSEFLTWLAEQVPCCSCCSGDDEFKQLVVKAREKLRPAVKESA